MVKGVFWFAGWLAVGLGAALMRLPEGVPGANPYLNLALGTEGATAIFSTLGMVGVGIVIAGKLRVGAWLMLVCAVGVVASAVAHTLLLAMVMAPVANIEGRSVSYYYPGVIYYVVWLAPGLALLAAAALAFLARRRSSS